MDFDVSTPVRVLIALILVVGLIGLVFWLVRRFGGERLGSTSSRGRQPRLAVIDAATVDGRRRLVLIRRDNVEHLLMIGGPTDLVVEPNIVRAASAPRETTPARPAAAADALPRPMPLGEGTMWPLQPEPAPRMEPVPRAEPAAKPEPPPRVEPAARPQRTAPPVAEEPAGWPAEAPSAAPAPASRERRSRVGDSLAGLAEELARAPTPTEPAPVEQPARQAPRREPRVIRPQSAPPVAAPAPAPAAKGEFNSAADQNLADMAQRLEAALRRPPKGDEARTAQPSAKAAPAAPAAPAAAEEQEEVAEAASQPAAPARGAQSPERPGRSDGRPDSRPPRPEAKPAPQRSLYDSLEQEMASLLGHPNNKP